MKNEASCDLRIRTKDEARRTIQEGLLIDRGFLPNRFTLVVIFAALGLCWVEPVWSMAPIGVLALDYAWFVVRRRRVLRQYEAGEPRLKTPADFEAMAEAFKRRSAPEPTMTDWHEAAGFGGVPQWREDLRYRIAASHYRGGVLLDVGCGDGRLCWRYHACDPRDYIGVDVAPGGLETVSSKTQGQARTVLAVAEDLGLPDESVDMVICSEAFEHLPKPETALAEFNRVLKHQGRIVIQSPNALRLRNFNLFHLLSLVVGYWVPAVLLAKVVHPNTFVDAFTYHWDFTRQDVSRYARACPGLSVESVKGATYRFNPEGSLVHRLCARLFRLPVVHWLGWDLTLLLQKQ
jgi:SAM-dependent methyltransferase